MISKFATRLVKANNLSVLTKRNLNGTLYQFSPPKNKLSNGELAVFGVVLAVGILGPSIYLASNFQEFNGKAAARRAASA